MSIKIISALALPCFLGVQAWAALDVYPAPPGLAASTEYRVEISQDGKASEAFVYFSTAKWRSNKVKDTAWTTFAFDGRVTVRVTKLRGVFKSCKQE